jgi:hypothetical protein
MEPSDYGEIPLSKKLYFVEVWVGEWVGWLRGAWAFKAICAYYWRNKVGGGAQRIRKWSPCMGRLVRPPHSYWYWYWQGNIPAFVSKDWRESQGTCQSTSLQNKIQTIPSTKHGHGIRSQTLPNDSIKHRARVHQKAAAAQPAKQ